MTNWRPILTVVVLSVLGALGTLAVAAAIGMRGSDLLHLAGFLAPAAVVTIVAMAVARRLLAGSSARQRMVAVAVVGACLSLANLAVLSREMFVSRHDATLLASLLVYAAAAGVGAAWCSDERLRSPLRGLPKRLDRWGKDILTRALVASMRHRDGLLEVAVADTGTGIPPHDLALVFEPFYRADPARSGAVSGLGLTLAWSIVGGLGGYITAESRPDTGSRFTICLPVEAPSR